jgi:hypothetical protein
VVDGEGQVMTRPGALLQHISQQIPSWQQGAASARSAAVRIEDTSVAQALSLDASTYPVPYASALLNDGLDG